MTGVPLGTETEPSLGLHGHPTFPRCASLLFAQGHQVPQGHGPASPAGPPLNCAHLQRHWSTSGHRPWHRGVGPQRVFLDPSHPPASWVTPTQGSRCLPGWAKAPPPTVLAAGGLPGPPLPILQFRGHPGFVSVSAAQGILQGLSSLTRAHDLGKSPPPSAHSGCSPRRRRLAELLGRGGRRGRAGPNARAKGTHGAWRSGAQPRGRCQREHLMLSFQHITRILFHFISFHFIFTVAPMAYGNSQTRDQTHAAEATPDLNPLCHSGNS